MNNKFVHNKRLDPVKVKSRQLELRKLGKPHRNVDICKATGISPVQVCVHISGQGRNPVIQQAIADFLQVPLSTLFEKPHKSVVRPSTAPTRETGDSSGLAASAEGGS